jgi:hypothetical protein
VVCPLCGSRRGRRACPALGKQICAVCCGTKRLVEIHCPSDCAYLATAREHPPAAVLRRQERDVELLVQSMRDLNQRQSQLFFLIATFLMRYHPPELQPLIDDDVAGAAAALAATSETAVRGVIYEHRPASPPAERLATALKPLLATAGQEGGTPFERDAAVVLRRIEEAAREARATDRDNRTVFLDFLSRVIPKSDEHEPPTAAAPRLIVS